MSSTDNRWKLKISQSNNRHLIFAKKSPYFAHVLYKDAEYNYLVIRIPSADRSAMTFKSLNSTRFGLGVAAALLCLALSAPALAQDMPAHGGVKTAKEYIVAPGEETHPPIKLAPDKTELVHLDTDANSVIIGNPAHLNILLDNPRLLLLAARQPGATQFTVLSASGKVIMQRHVIISGPQEKYVRIRRACINGGSGCAPTTVYYCPGICHDVRLLAGQGNNNGNPGAAIPGAPAEEEDLLEDEIPLMTSDEQDAAEEDDDAAPAPATPAPSSPTGDR